MPHIMVEERFAIKGGTAINLFYRDLPRLSVDIDLTYVPIESRDVTLANITEIFNRMGNNIRAATDGIVTSINYTKERNAKQLLVRSHDVGIKIEINHIMRGVVNSCQVKDLCINAQEEFGTFVAANVVSFEDVYAGKICAALDRQHPRDLFDVKILLENEGISDDLRKAFIIYLASNNRPISELIEPNRLAVRHEAFKGEFEQMTEIDVAVEDLLKAHEDLIQITKRDFTNDERLFLLSLKEGNPKWNLLGIEGVEKLPAIQWKLKNIQKMKPEKHKAALNELKRKLEM